MESLGKSPSSIQHLIISGLLDYKFDLWPHLQVNVQVGVKSQNSAHALKVWTWPQPWYPWQQHHTIRMATATADSDERSHANLGRPEECLEIWITILWQMYNSQKGFNCSTKQHIAMNAVQVNYVWQCLVGPRRGSGYIQSPLLPWCGIQRWWAPPGIHMHYTRYTLREMLRK